MDPFGFLLGNLEVIIGEPKRPEVNHAEVRESDEFVVETRPKDARHKHGANHQHDTHGGCALLHPVKLSNPVNFLRTASRMSNFQSTQPSANQLAKAEAEQINVD